MLRMLTRRTITAALGVGCAALVAAAGASASRPHQPSTRLSTQVAAQPASPGAASTAATELASLDQGVLAQINAFRIQNHLATLTVSPLLTSSARDHSQQMAAAGYFTHESADGTLFWKRIARFYPSTSAFWSVGENLLWSSPDVSAGGAMQLWLNSPEHKANLLDPRWREIGISSVHATAAPGTYKGLPVTIVTTDFGVRR